MAIDHKKVLIVYNSNAIMAVAAGAGNTSLDLANYYADQRGLKTGTNYHRMGFDFGPTVNVKLRPAGVSYVVDPLSPNTAFPTLTPTSVTTSAGTTNAYNGLPIMQALANFISDNAIEAVLSECSIPHIIDAGPQLFGQSTPYTSYPYSFPTETYFSFAPSFPSGPPVSNCRAPDVGAQLFGVHLGQINDIACVFSLPALKGVTNKPPATGAFIEGNLLTGLVPASPLLNRFSATNRRIAIPHGRIGFPTATPTDIRRIIDDAVWAESQNNKLKTHLVGGSTYRASNSPYDNVSCNVLFAQRGYSPLQYWNDEPSTYPEYVGTIRSWNDYDTGLATLAVFGQLHGKNQSGPSPAGTYPNYNGGTFVVPTTLPPYNQCNPLRGGWVYAWGSSAGFPTIMTLRRGGVAGVATVDEPFEDGIPGQLQFCANILTGMSMAESLFLAGYMTAPKATIYGDPLYRPYKQTPYVATEFLLGV